MPQLIEITTPLSPALVASTEAGIAGIHTILDLIKIVLTSAQVKDEYKVGAIRTSEISVIYTKLMKGNPETIPDAFTLAEFDALTQEGVDSDSLQAMLLALAAICGAHGEIVQNNRMFWALQCLDNARLIGKTKASIQTIVDEIAVEFFKKGAASKKTPTVYSIATSASITITGVSTRKYFTNSGTTILSFLKVGALVSETITVNPGSGILIPIEWTKIVVTNLSATSDGQFGLFIAS